jgi:transcriptional regulator with XRE-family HTH domain
MAKANKSYSQTLKGILVAIIKNGEYTQQEVADILDIDQQTIHRWLCRRALNFKRSGTPHPLDELLISKNNIINLNIAREYIKNKKETFIPKETPRAEKQKYPPKATKFKIIELEYKGLARREISEKVGMEWHVGTQNQITQIINNLHLRDEYDQTHPHEALLYTIIEIGKNMRAAKHCGANQTAIADRTQNLKEKLKNQIGKSTPEEILEFIETKSAEENLTDAEISALRNLARHISKNK